MDLLHGEVHYPYGLVNIHWLVCKQGLITFNYLDYWWNRLLNQCMVYNCRNLLVEVILAMGNRFQVMFHDSCPLFYCGKPKNGLPMVC